jgi:Na+-driven multidrug efflux pump
VADAFSVGDFVAVALAAVGVASLVTLVVYGLVSPRRRLLAGQGL